MADDSQVDRSQDARSTVARTDSSLIAPPVAVTTLGPRASALQRLYADATAHVLKTCSYKNFASCFPSPAAASSDILKDLHHQFTTDLGRQMRLNFDVILQDSNVVPRLNELDGLIDDAKKRRARASEAANSEPVQRPLPPHTLPARDLYLAHLAPSLSHMSEALRQEQDQLADENVQLLQTVMAQRQQIKELMGGLETAVGHLEQAATAIGHEELDRLQDQVRSADEEMRAFT